MLSTAHFKKGVRGHKRTEWQTEINTAWLCLGTDESHALVLCRGPFYHNVLRAVTSKRLCVCIFSYTALNKPTKLGGHNLLDIALT